MVEVLRFVETMFVLIWFLPVLGGILYLIIRKEG